LKELESSNLNEFLESFVNQHENEEGKNEVAEES